MTKHLVIFSLVGCVVACQFIKHNETEDFEQSIPAYFPTINYPTDNTPTKARIALGKKLFFDPILSEDSTVSCASCHLPELAFADDEPVSPGVQGRLDTRNAPTLLNVAFNPHFFADGGVLTLEEQALGPIQDENEMNLSLMEATERLSRSSNYTQMSEQAYGREPSPYVITRALAAFQRTLISTRTKYDSVVDGKASFTELEYLGKQLFFSDSLNCSKCHQPPLFTDFEFHNIGLAEQYEDEGRYKITLKEEDKGKFKTPTLRNVLRTAPYMHNGSLATIEEVLTHFYKGGRNHRNKSQLLKSVKMNEQETQALIAFLNTLSDEK